MKQFLTYLAGMLSAIILVVAIVQPTPVAEAKTVSHIDTSAIESWDGDFSSGNIRMVGAWVKGYEGNTVLIEDETGNIWMMDDCYIDDDAFLLLWLADNHTPNNAEDDLIIKVWTELH